MSSFLPFHRATITEEHVEAVASAVRSGWLTSGPKVLEFEEAFAKKVGAKHAVAVNSCTAALHLSLIALGVSRGDEVITSPITFASAVNVIEHVGATPIFADVRDGDLTLDPESVRSRITPRTKLIIATHLAGVPASMDALAEVSGGIPIVTDAAHAIEATYRGRLSGQLGVAACYSFYATKNITTGEGGMLATDDDVIAARARSLRLHGMTKDAWARYTPGGYRHWDISEAGWKYNMSDIQAALGIAQLREVDVWLEKRAYLVEAYRRLCYDLDIGYVSKVDVDATSAHHLFAVRVPNRDRVMSEVQLRGVGVGVHFRAVHQLKHYREKYGPFAEGALTVAEKASGEILSLPLYPSMDIADICRVSGVLRGVLSDIQHNLC